VTQTGEVEASSSGALAAGARPTRRLALALLSGALLLLPGCAHRYEFLTGRPAGTHRVSKTVHQGLYGWAGNDAVFDLDAACPEGVAELGSRIEFLDWLPTFLTLGLYTPRTAYAVCAQPQALP
jgi:hypothetical protein